MSRRYDDFVVEEALRIIKAAQDSRIEMRLIGSVAVVVVAGEDFSDRPSRIKDIDLISELKQRCAVQNFLKSRDWELAHEFLLFSETRETYHSARYPFSLDVYYDEVDGNHRVRIGSRLTLTYPTVTPIDLLLTKLQRVHLRPQDEWDACALLRSKFTQPDLDRFAEVVGQSWGLYTTTSKSLMRLASKCESAEVYRMVEAAKKSRKSILWYMRSLIGSRVKWWTDVYDARLGERGEKNEDTFCN